MITCRGVVDCFGIFLPAGRKFAEGKWQKIYIYMSAQYQSLKHGITDSPSPFPCLTPFQVDQWFGLRIQMFQTHHLATTAKVLM